MADPADPAVMVAAAWAGLAVGVFVGVASAPPARTVAVAAGRPGRMTVGRWRLRRAHVVGAGALVAGAVIVGPVLAVLVGLLVLLGRWWSQRRAIAADLAAREAVVPELVELVAVALRSGASPASAIDRVAHVTGDLPARPVRLAADRLRSGLPAADAWAALDELPGEIGASMIDLLDSAERTGAPVADAMADLATSARDERRRRLETAVQRLPVLLLGPLVLCVLPSFVLLVCVPIVVTGLSSFL